MPTPTPKLTALLARRIGWVLFAIALLLGIALATTTWSSFSSVRSASGLLINGQAGNIFRSIGLTLRNAEEPTQEQLAALIEQERDQGITYLAFFNNKTSQLTEAGTSALTRPELLNEINKEKIFHQITLPERIIVIGRPPPPKNTNPTEINMGPVIVMEFFPSEAKNLEAESKQTLIIGVIATLVLLLSSLALAGLLRKQAELERKHAQEQQLAALGSMSAVLAHELHNPLTSLKGHSQLLLDSLSETDPNIEKVERIVRDSMRLENLTNNLLDFIKTGKIEKQQADPRSLMLLSAEAVDPKRIQLDLDRAPLICSLDPERMQQALVNLMRNAIEASPADAEIGVALFPEGQHLIITIRDHGPGVKPGQEEKIFTPFYTTRTKGTGLGLAVSKRIIELHQGTIAATNHPEGGALFTISIPLA